MIPYPCPHFGKNSWRIGSLGIGECDWLAVSQCNRHAGPNCWPSIPTSFLDRFLSGLFLGRFLCATFRPTRRHVDLREGKNAKTCGFVAGLVHDDRFVVPGRLLKWWSRRRKPAQVVHGDGFSALRWPIFGRCATTIIFCLFPSCPTLFSYSTSRTGRICTAARSSRTRLPTRTASSSPTSGRRFLKVCWTSISPIWKKTPNSTSGQQPNSTVYPSSTLRSLPPVPAVSPRLPPCCSVSPAARPPTKRSVPAPRSPRPTSS